MEVVKYTDKWKTRWDDFVLTSNNGTMFHMQQFFTYHQPGKFTWNHLMMIENSKIIAVLPGAVVDGVYESPIGASYGSIVTESISFQKTLDIVDGFIDYGRRQQFKGYMLTAAPMIYESQPNQNLDFALLWRGFKYDLHYISSAIYLDKRPVLPRFSPTIRRNIRKYLDDPDLRVEENDRYDQFYPILMDNKNRHSVKPTHSLEDLLKLKELMPDRLKLFMVYYKDKPIGGSCMFYANDIVAICFYNMLLYDYQQYKPIQRVMYEVVKDAAERGYRYVDIGVSQETKAENPMTPRISLIDFKEKFDAKTIMRNTLVLDL